MGEAPRILILSGHDPTGGSGVARDVATVRRFDGGAIVRPLITAWTRQGRGRAQGWARDPEIVSRELARVGPATVLKIGLVPAALARELAARLPVCPTVVDPVLGASAGGSMGASPAALVELVRALGARAPVLVTPNRVEARALAASSSSCGRPRPTSARSQTERSAPGAADPGALAARLGGVAVLVKDAGEGDEVCDLLYAEERVHTYSRARRPGPDPRGTGCALATAIACGLARGASVSAAVGRAITWLDGQRALARPGADGAHHLPT